MSPITHLPTNTHVVIRSVNGSDTVRKRLTGMGLVKRARVLVVRASPHSGLVLIKHGNRRLAIRCGKSLQIICSKI
jgi:Fe2+ transport system protein FeoA